MTLKVFTSEEQYSESVKAQTDEEDSSDNISDYGSSSNKETDESENDELNTENKAINPGWADSIGKILRTNKPKGKKTLVLSKAKKLTDVRRDKPKDLGFQIEGEIKEEKPDPLLIVDQIKKDPEEPPNKRKKELASVRVKPNILDKGREKTLSKIATRGVVQLFNAVRMQQKDIHNKLEEVGSLERKRDKVVKSIDKRQFLNVLMGEKSQLVDDPVKDEIVKPEKETKSGQNDSTWNVLRDDFMMGAKLKDWDKEMEEEDEQEEIDELSDSS